MAIATEGNGGTSTSSLATKVGTNLSLFTTPSTTNAIFIITISIAHDTTATVSGDKSLNIQRMIAGPSTPISVALYNGSSATVVQYVTWSYIGIVIT